MTRSDRFEISDLTYRVLPVEQPYRLASERNVALALTVVLQSFPIDHAPSFAVPGMLDRPYPDIGNATQREVGLRDGLWRIEEAIEQHQMATSFVIEQDAIEAILNNRETICAPRNCLIAGGRNAATLHSQTLNPVEEARIIRDCKRALESYSGQRVYGWRSPSCSQSSSTTSILAAEGFLFCGDFNNHDRPFKLATSGGPIVAVPMHHFSSDLHAVFVSRQPIEEYLGSVRLGLEWLLRRKWPHPVVVPLVIHPWITGVPHRFRHFSRFLDGISRLPEIATVNCATVAETYLASAPDTQSLM